MTSFCTLLAGDGEVVDVALLEEAGRDAAGHGSFFALSGVVVRLLLHDLRVVA